MGVAVVLFTLWLASASLSYSANDAQMANAKDVLLLVLGLAGVVIGYYFGRIPADPRDAGEREGAAGGGGCSSRGRRDGQVPGGGRRGRCNGARSRGAGPRGDGEPAPDAG